MELGPKVTLVKQPSGYDSIQSDIFWLSYCIAFKSSASPLRSFQPSVICHILEARMPSDSGLFIKDTKMSDETFVNLTPGTTYCVCIENCYLIAWTPGRIILFPMLFPPGPRQA
ncbi:hypothetical protein C8J56DRAFT_1062391 [Mycena floridula]|nr:hypothetical protein C8J56DRAFT_1062391 [Mycena floridula]